MKFQTNDILENRHGTKVVITNVDTISKQYHYKYLFASSPQFQGDFCHSSDDIERFWSYVGKNLNMSTNISAQDLRGVPTQSSNRKHCAHEIAMYVGFTKRYKYCKKCDEKFEA